jgi:hypothetical protein
VGWLAGLPPVFSEYESDREPAGEAGADRAGVLLGHGWCDVEGFEKNVRLF